MLVKVLEVWAQKFPAEKAREFKKADGTVLNFEARDERIELVAVCADVAPTGIVAQVRIPDMYKTVEDLPVGSHLQMEIPEWPSDPLRARNVTRLLKPADLVKLEKRA